MIAIASPAEYSFLFQLLSLFLCFFVLVLFCFVFSVKLVQYHLEILRFSIDKFISLGFCSCYCCNIGWVNVVNDSMLGIATVYMFFIWCMYCTMNGLYCIYLGNLSSQVILTVTICIIVLIVSVIVILGVGFLTFHFYLHANNAPVKKQQGEHVTGHSSVVPNTTKKSKWIASLVFTRSKRTNSPGTVSNSIA